jgi:homoserine O-acetyltransferase
MLLQHHLGIKSVKCVIGGSFGGMQTLEFAVQAGIRGDASNDNDPADDDDDSPFVRSVIPIACNAQHSAWQIGISEVQRQAIQKDPQWNIDPFQATEGLEIARQIGMISYRTHAGYQAKFGRRQQQNQQAADAEKESYGSSASWQVKQYLEYQGRKFLTRFDPITYVKLTEQMDSHNVFRNRSRDILQRVQIPALVMGISSDVLYPLVEQIELSQQLGNATLKIIDSPDGHDGFLLEQEQVGNHIVDFLDAHE